MKTPDAETDGVTWEQLTYKWKRLADDWSALYFRAAKLCDKWERIFWLMALNILLAFVLGWFLRGAI